MTPLPDSVPAVGLRLANVGVLEAAGGREAEPVGLGAEARGVAHRRHLDAGLGAVQEGVEHLGVDRRPVLDLQVLVEDVPHRVRRGAVIGRVVARALARRDDLEAAGPRPIHHLADHRRLVAPGQRIDHAGRPRLPRQQRPGERVGLDIDHHHMLAVGEAGLREADARARIARGLHDDLDGGMPDHRLGVLRQVGGAGPQRVVEAGRRAALRRPVGHGELRAGAGDIEVGHGHDVHPAVSRACARNIVPNLPAPTRPTVTGRPAAWRSSSMRWRFMGVSGLARVRRGEA